MFTPPPDNRSARQAAAGNGSTPLAINPPNNTDPGHDTGSTKGNKEDTMNRVNAWVPVNKPAQYSRAPNPRRNSRELEKLLAAAGPSKNVEGQRTRELKSKEQQPSASKRRKVQLFPSLKLPVSD